MNCPNCNASNLLDHDDEYQCQFCGTEFLITKQTCLSEDDLIG